jgi:Serine incorporator (Serinc)
LFLSICLSIVYQYWLAPFLVESWALSTVTTFFEDTWLDGCEQFKDDVVLQKRCAGNNGNFRVGAATTLFFLLAAVAVACRPTANREAWPAKIILYLFMVAATAVIPSDPIFSDVYLNIARGKKIVRTKISFTIFLEIVVGGRHLNDFKSLIYVLFLRTIFDSWRNHFYPCAATDNSGCCVQLERQMGRKCQQS